MDSDFNLTENNNIKHIVTNTLKDYNNNATQTSINCNNILYLNARSIRNEKFDELMSIIAHTPHTIHLICITETWLNPDEEIYYNIPNYNCYFQSRNKRGGGVSIYVHVSIKSDIVCKFNDNNDSYLLIKLLNMSRNSVTNIGVIYRAPNSDIQHFYENITELFKKENTIIIGDMNINIQDSCNDIQHSKDQTQNYNNILHSYGYYIINKTNNIYHTRKGNSTNTSIIDHLLTNMYFLAGTLTIFSHPVSDHRLIMLNIKHSKPCEISNPEKTYTNWKKVYNTINNMSLQINSDVNTSVHNMVCDIKSVIEANTTKDSKMVKNKFNKDFVTKDLILLIEERDKFYMLKRKFPHLQVYKTKFIECRNKVTLKRRQLKQEKFSSLYSDITNVKQLWSGINYIMYNKPQKTNNQFPTKLIDPHNETVTHTNELSIVNCLNKYFSNIGNEITKSIATNTQNSIDTSNTSIYFYKTTPNEIKTIISNLKNTTAKGADNISTQTIKQCSPNLCKPISMLINLFS
jgi:hypothetical protein